MADLLDLRGLGDAGHALESEGRLLAENAKLMDRLHHVSRALLRMANELTRTRDEIAALRRENARLRARAGAHEADAPRAQPASITQTMPTKSPNPCERRRTH